MRGNAGQCRGKREPEGAILRPEGATCRGRQGKKAKNLQGARQNDPPPLEKKVVSETGLSSPNRYIAQTLRVSDIFSIFTLICIVYCFKTKRL